MFQLDPTAPDFIFRYEGMDPKDAQKKSTAWVVDQGQPGAYYYYRMEDDELFKFDGYDGYSPEEFIRAAAAVTPEHRIPGAGLEQMAQELSDVPALPDAEHSARSFAEDCDIQLNDFEQRLAALEGEEKDSILSLITDGDTEEGPVTEEEKTNVLRARYESYKSYGVYSVYSLSTEDPLSTLNERKKQQMKYLDQVEDFEGRVEELKKDLHTITDDEGEFEIVKPQSRGRRRKDERKRLRKE
ncbi:hypothetical protein BDP27DRAFT_1316114 [Rhodocollybia butyracea]|uniref:Uncharacterized protein n=1 Tax=Rhodocollybia butyracea TaxID=206335 RepID=A0A9P5Q6B3_9AGAR|nr:hypothetical protein BDP27DRAFT_1316114 [Rhodocollybia butyracea]